MVAVYCEAVGIDFVPEALTWEPGSATEDYSWFDGGSWHEKLKGSTGLSPQEPGFTDINTAPDYAKELYEEVLPHYQHLHAHRLQPANTPLST